MQLSDIVRSIRQHWKVAVGIIAATAVLLGVFLVTRNQVQPKTQYASGAQVQIPAVDSKGVRPQGVPAFLLQGQVGLAGSDSVMEEAYRLAKVPPKKQDDVLLGVSQSEGGDIIVLTASAGDPDLATLATRSYANAYIRSRAAAVVRAAKNSQLGQLRSIDRYGQALAKVEDELKSKGVALPEIVAAPTGDAPTDNTGSVDATAQVVIPTPPGASLEVQQLITTRNFLANAIRSTQAAYARAELQTLSPSERATLIEQSPADQITPPAPSPLVPIAAALGVGLLLALAVPVLMDRFDHTVKDARTAAALLGAPVLTTVPALTRAGHRMLATPGSPHDAAFRSLAATAVATDRLPRAIVVTSPEGSVQDMVAANFAAALASLGLKVALVGTNTSQSWFLESSSDGSGAITFPDLLARAHAGTLNGEVEHRLANSDLANLIIVPPGTGDDLELPLDGLPPLLAALEQANIDITVIAGPPMLADPNATIFAWATRSVLWVVEIGELTHKAAQESAERLELAGVDPFGVAMVGREI